MMTDPIADMLTRVRNALAARKEEVLIPFSKFKFEIAKILKHEDYVAEVEVVETHKFPQIRIKLAYDQKKPKISHLQRVSTPGRRVYIAKEEIPTVLNGIGVAIISTSKGLMTSRQAKREGVGGEYVCEIW